jgi:hypothetical protein
MGNFQETLNEILKMQMGAFIDSVCRINMDSQLKMSMGFSKGAMKLHFKAKEIEAQIKSLSTYSTLYVKEEDD